MCLQLIPVDSVSRVILPRLDLFSFKKGIFKYLIQSSGSLELNQSVGNIYCQDALLHNEYKTSNKMSKQVTCPEPASTLF